MRRALPLCLMSLGLLAGQTKDEIEFFEKKIRPVLARCTGCHGAKAVSGGLRLDTRAGLRKGGNSGPAINEKDPAKSPLLLALLHEGPIKMPPGRQLDREVLVDFAEWVHKGAPDPRTEEALPTPPPYDFAQARRHWAYRPVKDSPPPAVKDPAWSANGIDRFLKARLDAAKLAPVGLASKRALLRRAAFDLTGLPPTPAEVDAFLRDESPTAFERVVDRLLASPQYGERQGRRWLDVVRYADTAGCNSDFPVPDAYRYRDWVIRAFNEDKPYPEFLREQIAGDLMTAKDAEDRRAKIIATSYVALSRRFASNKNEHHLTIDDTIDNLTKATMGLTVSCARCHDHKFDAIPQRDYWGLYGIFQSTVYAFPGVETFPRPHDRIALNGAEDQKKLTAWEQKIITSHEQIRELRFGAGRNKPDSKEQLDRLKNEILQTEMNPPPVPSAYAVKDGQGSDARMHVKGDPKKLADRVPRGFLTILGGQRLPEGFAGSGRAELAGWIAGPENPLMARVMVNRLWQGHFGKGLVPTPNDFGVRGEAPTHPELLDWLAARFAESGYSVKKMHKLMMLSRAYRLAAAHDAANAEKDPRNAYQWRFDRRRLEAEELRDGMLAVSGLLDPTPSGPHPFPPVHTWTYSQHRQFFAQYDTPKRSIYQMQQRLKKHPLLELFDQADPNASTAVRGANITALQALSLMNSDFVQQQADAFAVRVGMARQDTAGRIRYAHELALGRPADAREINEGTAYLARAEAALRESGLPADRQPRAALASYLRALLSSDEFFFVD